MIALGLSLILIGLCIVAAFIAAGAMIFAIDFFINQNNPLGCLALLVVCLIFVGCVFLGLGALLEK